MNNQKPILLVEDDRVDAMTIKRALSDLNIMNPLIHALNGQEALRLLTDEQHELPCIILLDLNMPKMNGLEFLSAIRNHEKFKTIPVIILTTSNEERDRTKSEALGVSGYMQKPVDYRVFVEMLKEIKMYVIIN